MKTHRQATSVTACSASSGRRVKLVCVSHDLCAYIRQLALSQLGIIYMLKVGNMTSLTMV